MALASVQLPSRSHSVGIGPSIAHMQNKVKWKKRLLFPHESPFISNEKFFSEAIQQISPNVSSAIIASRILRCTAGKGDEMTIVDSLKSRREWARDFPGGRVAKTPCSQCRGPGFDPWSGN